MLIFPENIKNVAKYFDLVISGRKFLFFSNGSIKIFGLRQYRWVSQKGGNTRF
jgi:hypothetical protein